MRHPHDFDPNQPQPGNRNHFDPSQPRVPKGHHGGGQWTDGKERALSKLRVAFADLDPSVRTPLPEIPSPPLQPQTPSPPPQPRIPSRPPRTRQLGGTLGAILSAWLAQRDSGSAILKRYDQLSEYNNGERQAVLFLGREFGRDPNGQFRLLDARMLTREEVNRLCENGVNDLQELIDDAVNETKPYRDRLSPSQYGTEIHSKVEQKIKETPKNKSTESTPENESTSEKFRPEISFVKMSEERANAEDPDNPPPYEEGDRGEKGSIRLDILQPIMKKRTVCIHDLKTLREGLSPARIREFVRRVSGTKEYRGAQRIIVTEARPSDGWRMGRRLTP